MADIVVRSKNQTTFYNKSRDIDYQNDKLLLILTNIHTDISNVFIANLYHRNYLSTTSAVNTSDKS